MPDKPSTVLRWIVPEPDPARRAALAQDLGVSPITAQILLNRHVEDTASARKFLSPKLNDLAEPRLLPDLDAAVDRLDHAARHKENVVIYGDYDVDGASATALLVRFLRLAGLDVDYYIPHRIEEGYGLNVGAIDELRARGADLIITVDCGVSAVEETARAREAGIDIIVTDHHEPGDEIPPAVAVIDPKRTESLYPFRELSGVGVAFKLAWALAERFSPGRRMADRFREFLLNSLGLVALGTVADMVPLLGENRVLAAYGLKMLSGTASPGLRALIDEAQLRRPRLSTRDIAFRLAPRLNAAGRMANARLAVELMITDDSIRARDIATELEQHNVARQKRQREMAEHAREMFLQQADAETARVIVLAHDDWHAGIVGIVASRLVDEFGRPTALIATGDGVGRGSARSVPGFHLFNALDGFRDRLLSFGGHEGAAGFQIAAADIPALREHLGAVAARQSPETFQPALDVDAEIELRDISERLISELERLAPHGEANRPPLLVVHGVHVAGKPRLIGMKAQHVSFYVSDGRNSFRTVGFWMGERVYDAIVAGQRELSLAFSPRIDTWSGSGAVELHLKDARFGSERNEE
ncbi:MAG: single-stranded-DNA-specific exonuclease RecJ [Planctomycetota bacterium]